MLRTQLCHSGLSWGGSRFSLVMGLCTVALLAGCGSPGHTPESYTVRDSAGMRIVESRGPAWERDEAWTVSEEPALHLGMVVGPEEYQFTVIGGRAQHGGVWQQGDATIVVADAGSRQIRRYSAGGMFLDLWGGRGQGPGEFGTLATFPYRGDTIVAVDGGRYSFYDARGNLGRTIVVQLTETAMFDERPLPIASTALQLGFGDGTFLAVRMPMLITAAPGQSERTEFTFLRFTPEGDLADTIVVHQGPDRITPDPSTAFLPQPFTPEFVFTVDENNLYVGGVDGFEVRRISLTGRTEGVIRAWHLDLRTTDADRAGYRDYARAIAGFNNRDLAAVERALLDVQYPETIPALSQLMIDPQGYLWARHYKYRWSDGPETWSVFAPEGYLLGTVDTPERLQVRQIGSDFIIGIWTDELDVRYIRKYDLFRH